MTSSCARAPALTADAGFSLIEALVALLVLAIGTVGLIRATEAHIDSIRALELRSAATWVAENRLAELGIEPQGALPPRVEMLGQEWDVAVEDRSSEDPDIRAVRVNVRVAGRTDTLASLDGFVDRTQPAVPR